MWCSMQHEDENKTNKPGLTEHVDKKGQNTHFVFTENSLDT